MVGLSGSTTRNGRWTLTLLAPLAARHRLDVAVSLYLHASAAHDAVFFLDAREHDLRAGTP